MENRHLIELPAPAPEWHRFLHGAEPAARATPASIAWTLEEAAVQTGWPEGAYVGSELELRSRFHASRTTIRQALRIVELHGSMQMRRGREGGLYLTRARVESAAAALATYLCASGTTTADIARTEPIVAALMGELAETALVRQLYDHTLRLFKAGELGPSAGDARAAIIAMRLVTSVPQIPREGMALGTEPELCARFNSSRPTFQQAMRVLDDLGMLQIRRGRSGGYVLRRPSLIGVIRQVFTLLASWQQSLQDIVPVTWALNLCVLRLCSINMRHLEIHTLTQHCERLESMLADAKEPQRWTLLQQQMSHLAGSTLLNTLLFSTVAYQARLGAPRAHWASIDQVLYKQEKLIVRALRGGDHDAAEHAQRCAQRQISQLLAAPDL